MKWLSLFAGLILLMPSAMAQDHPCQVGEKTVGVVERVTKNGDFFIQGDTTRYKPMGLYEPVTSLLPPNQRLVLYRSAEKADRYGRVSVQVWREPQGDWLQGQALSSGIAAYNGKTFSISATCRGVLIGHERRAIEQSQGRWGLPGALIAASDHHNILLKNGQFAVVEGRVLSVGDRERRLYLNFGQNWSEDFTVSIVKKGKGAFKGSLSRLIDLRGKTVRIRGVVEERRGPLIRVFDDGQIDVLGG